MSNMPSHVYLVTVLDLADFSRVKARKITKSRQAANHWGSTKAQALAEQAHSKGEAIINFNYEITAIEYLDN